MLEEQTVAYFHGILSAWSNLTKKAHCPSGHRWHTPPATQSRAIGSVWPAAATAACFTSRQHKEHFQSSPPHLQRIPPSTSSPLPGPPSSQ
eukprot:1678528-Rhodomonas_salina.2